MSELRCHHCSEPIGVYEPLITLVADEWLETSRAAALHLDGAQWDECFHRECFAQAHGDRASPK